jgi:VWFA-related protein
MRRIGLLVVIAAVVGLACAAPKKAAPGGPTRLVTLRVAVEEGRGVAAPELTRDDLEVFDNGKQQAITVFRKAGRATGEAGPKLEPGEVSNRSGTIPHVTVILFDVLNARMTQQGYARGEIIDALKKVDSADYLYFYLLTEQGLMPVVGLPEAGEGPPPQVATPWTKTIQPRLDQAMNAAYRMKPAMYTDERVMGTFSTMKMLAERLGAVAGRKNIVWISHGVPVDFEEPGLDPEGEMRLLGSTLDAAGVAVYPVDMNGNGEIGASAETLGEIAAMTGGRVYLDTEIAKAVTQAMADTASSYVVGYVPPPENWNGKLHKIKLKCSLKGVKLLAKSEYIAELGASEGGAQQQAALRAATLSPFDASEIGLIASMKPVVDSPGTVEVTLRVRAQDVELLPVGDQWAGSLVLIYAVLEEGAEPRATDPQPMDLHLSAAERERAMQEGIVVKRGLAFGGAGRIRAIVYDNYSNQVGSVTLRGAKRSGP